MSEASKRLPQPPFFELSRPPLIKMRRVVLFRGMLYGQEPQFGG